MNTAYPCSALIGGQCVNGFPITRGCIYMDNWNPERAPVPVCCDEEWPEDRKAEHE